MKVCVIGCDSVGLATGVILASLGHRVRFADFDDLKLASVRKGEAPFHESYLSSLLSNGIRKRRISVSPDIKEAVKSSEFIFIAVQIPVMKSGASNLKPLRRCAEEIGEALTKGKIVVVKSAVPPRITATVVVPILEKNSGLKAGRDFGIAMNPEFLQRGRSAGDSLKPGRIVVGSVSRKTAAEVMKLFEKIDAPKLLTDIETAEMIRFAFDCLLATKISYANEIANLCEIFGIDVQRVIEGVSLDPTIDDDSFCAGLGFGGGSLPKELSMLISLAESSGYRPELLRAVRRINEVQPLRAIHLLEEELGDLKGKRIAILGLAFRAGVDDVSDTKAFLLAVELLARGVTVVGYDPLASASFIRILPELSYASSAREALQEADGCIIQTEEEEFSKLGKSDFDLMRTKIVIDGRRILSATKLSRYGVRMRAIGLGRRA